VKMREEKAKEDKGKGENGKGGTGGNRGNRGNRGRDLPIISLTVAYLSFGLGVLVVEVAEVGELEPEPEPEPPEGAELDGIPLPWLVVFALE
jgi:hypothetical protein